MKACQHTNDIECHGGGLQDLRNDIRGLSDGKAIVGRMTKMQNNVLWRVNLS